MATAQQPLNSTNDVHHLSLNPPEALAVSVPTPLVLLQQAIAQGVSIDQLERLQAMYERWEIKEAKRAYDAAMKAFKAESPRISKNSRVNFTTSKGTTDYKHATLDHVCDAVISVLAKHGISHRWKVEQPAEQIRVTCILTHELGHAEETTLAGFADNTGNKNSIQAVGSTVTYLQRYTLLAATGLATSESDDDGRGGKTIEAGMTLDRVGQLGAWVAESANVNELRERYFAAYREAEKFHDKTAVQLFIRTKDARKRELQ